MLKLGEVFQTQDGVSLYSNTFKDENIFKLTLFKKKKKPFFGAQFKPLSSETSQYNLAHVSINDFACCKSFIMPDPQKH